MSLFTPFQTFAPAFQYLFSEQNGVNVTQMNDLCKNLFKNTGAQVYE